VTADIYAEFAQGVAYAIRQHTTKRHTGKAPALAAPYQASRAWYTVVTLSARHPKGGLPLRFEFKTPHISRLEAELRARAEVRRLGLRDWALLDIVLTDGHKTICTP
jgi:hypothetical protein